MIRIKEGEYLAVSENRMIEIHADTREEATKSANEIFDEKYILCKIPSAIAVVYN